MTDQAIRDRMRRRLLDRAGVYEPAKTVASVADLRQSEWSDTFETYMRNRLVIGAYRYGRLGAKGKAQYNRVAAIKRRAELYEKTHNMELRVDVANMALVEFVEGDHPDRHFSAVDDGEHVTERKDT